jgi:hypothetical protein
VSTSLAIAAATNAVRLLLEQGIQALDSDLNDVDVSTLPPDEALTADKPALNLFLYQTTINAGWSNLDMPRQVKPGESGRPPLALNLHYLITAYGKDDQQRHALNHRILGAAMSVLHDHPLLFPDDITDPSDSGLEDQFERLRITPMPLSVDEMSKLWSSFQSHYRVSAAYQVTVVLIESNLPARSPLPVLRRGEEDRGPEATAAAAAVLREARAPRSQPAARLGEELIVAGDNLQTADAVLRFASLLPPLEDEVLPPPLVELAPLPGDKDGEIKVKLNDIAADPDAWERWAPGMYTLSLVVGPSGEARRVSNPISFALAPTITLTPNSTTVANVNVGDVLTITCFPQIRERKVTFENIQRVIVLFGDQQVNPLAIAHPANKAQPTTITFEVPKVKAGGLYLVRLRVDNVDSIPVILTGPAQLPAFDPQQQVKV